jgi:hypothetical protein
LYSIHSLFLLLLELLGLLTSRSTCLRGLLLLLLPLLTAGLALPTLLLLLLLHTHLRWTGVLRMLLLLSDRVAPVLACGTNNTMLSAYIIVSLVTFKGW